MATVLLTGATGLIGSALVARLIADSHKVVLIVRNKSKFINNISSIDRVYEWQEAASQDFPIQALFEVDHVVHLAGEPIAANRWSAEAKRRIVDSRVVSTQKVMAAILELHASHHIQSVVCASAIGFYGDAGNEICDEQAMPGRGFLAETCVAWERALFGAVSEHAPRRVAIRTGLVLSAKGGALAKMLPVLRLGLGGKLGSGQQWISWIHLDDLVNIYEQAIFNKTFKGPLNAVSPQPVKNQEFIETLSKVLKKPAVIPVPEWVLKLTLGEMARVVLDSQRVVPAVLLKQGYIFNFTELKRAAELLLGKTPPKNISLK